MVTVWLQASPAEGNRATLLRGPQSGRQRSHVLPGQKQISGSQLVARQVPGTDWQGSGWGRDLGGREKWREVLQGRWQWAGVWLGQGSVPQFHSHRLLPHPIIKPEKQNKTNRHLNQTRIVQGLIPISPLGSYRIPPPLLGPGYPRSAPSPTQPGLPL